MARRKREQIPQPGAPAWTVTFGDLMNLLLCFFVVLFAFSTIDSEKYEEIANSFSSGFGIIDQKKAPNVSEGKEFSVGTTQLNNLSEYFNNMDNNSDVSEEADTLKKYEKELVQKQRAVSEAVYEEVSEASDEKQLDNIMDITMDKNYQYVKISLNGAILFDSGKADIKSGAKPILSRVADILKIYQSYLIKIEGHTDNVPVKKDSLFKSNMWLSTARATTVFEYFVNEKGLNPDMLEASGRSEYEPIASNENQEGREKNRRVEIKIYTDFKSKKR